MPTISYAQAIRLYRNFTGLGLKESKDRIDSIREGVGDNEIELDALNRLASSFFRITNEKLANIPAIPESITGKLKLVIEQFVSEYEMLDSYERERIDNLLSAFVDLVRAY